MTGPTVEPMCRPARHGRYWAPGEDEVIREHYGTLGGPARCAELLNGRSLSAVYARGHCLGIPGKRYAPARPGARKYTIEPWIDIEIRRVYEARPEHRGAVNELARRVGRPRWWVGQRALALELKVPRFKEPDWTPAELELLADLAHHLPAVIARKFRARGFRRSETAIVVMRKRQSLDLRDPDHFTAHQLARLMGVDAKTVARWIHEGGLPASRRGTERVAAQGGDAYWIGRRQLRSWIGRHAQLIDLRKVDRFWFLDLAFGGAG